MTLTQFRVPLVCLSGACLSGCLSVGPDYESPDFAVHDAWSRSALRDISRTGGSTGKTSLEGWWKGFKDPTLNELIVLTREANPTLRIASERVAQARAQRGIARSQLFPFLNGSGQYSRDRTSENLGVPVPENPSNLYVGGFDAGWEIDVFGGIRRNVEASVAGIDVAVEDYRDVICILFAETALNYIDYRTLQERIKIAEKNIAAQEKTVGLTQNRFDAELVPKIDVTQATTNLETSRALLPTLRTELALAKNRLGTLTGGFPQDVEKVLNRSRPIPRPRKGYSAGLPADLIRARPDVRSAERALASQTALIGVAEAELYPRFTLFGSFTLQSVDSSDFWDSASRAYSFGPAFSWQIFSAGRIRNSIRSQESVTEQALANYENAVLAAVEEVETSMSAVANGWELEATLGRAVKSADETVKLVLDNYQNGLIDFQRVLDAERTLFSVQDEFVNSKGAIALSYVALYKSLGGGTEVEVIPESNPTTKASGLFGGKKNRKAPPESESPETASDS